MKMTLTEAREKAQTQKQDVYNIPFESMETAKSLVGKKFQSKKPGNTNVLEAVEWVGQNYIMLVNEKDYSVSPVMWVIANINNLKVS